MRQKIGDYQVMGPAVNYSESQNIPRSPPPKLGEHTNNVLQQVLSLDDREIKILHDKGIIYDSK